MTRNTFQIKFADLGLKVTDVERVLGYRDGETEETISELISSILYEAELKCNVKAEYAVFPVTCFNDLERTIEIENIIFDVRKIVYGQIKKSESVAIFLCTAGEEIGARSRKAMKDGDLLTGYIYDVVGSEVVEAAADIMQNNLRQYMLSEGLRITNRYSPGYCGWDVSEQHKLFRLMPSNFCGIRLTPSALMDPVKSVSGFIGIGPNVRYNKYTCNLCEMKDCIYRKLKTGK